MSRGSASLLAFGVTPKAHRSAVRVLSREESQGLGDLRAPWVSTASSSGAPSTGQTWSSGNTAREGPSNDPRAGTPLLGGKAERVGAVQSGEEKAPGRPYCSLT